MRILPVRLFFVALYAFLLASLTFFLHPMMADQPKTLEIGVILLLPDKESKAAKVLSAQCIKALQQEKLQVSEKENTPHISLFQMCINVASLPKLKEALSRLRHPRKLVLKLKKNVDDTQENIFWNLESTPPDLEEFQKSIVRTAKDYRSKHALMKQVEREKFTLSHPQKKAVDTYGVFWGLPGNFNPHVTLVYSSGQDRKNKEGVWTPIAKAVQDIQVETAPFCPALLAIGKLDIEGNVLEVLEIVHRFDPK